MNILAKIAKLIKSHQKEIFLGFCLLFIAIIGYHIGKMNSAKNTMVSEVSGADVYQAQTQNTTITQAPPAASVKPKDPRVVVSKASSNKKYHFSWCPGASKIKEANKTWFPNEDTAKAAGYTLAGNCQ